MNSLGQNIHIDVAPLGPSPGKNKNNHTFISY